ncbi:hypothetical protein V0M98_33710 (plasmid) [Pseudomonas silesiensis]|uniref:hypothetical protein n=1 Tax=Pseudomonas silesiensis TaxID=1853130 RepID=UPI0030CD4D6D
MPGMGFLNDGYEPSNRGKNSPKVEKGPNFNGVGLNSGPIDLAPVPGEGFALLHCGGTAVKIGYSNMRLICTLLHAGSRDFSSYPEASNIQKAFNGVACEASVGNAPITSSFSEHELKVAREKLARVQAALDALAEAIKS